MSAPPDTIGAVGPNHYVQVVNTSLAIFSKTGTVLYGPVPTKTLWAGFGGNCETRNDGDGAVQYDPIADRWLISQFSVIDGTGPFLQCVAVSATPDPTGAYFRYSFTYGGFNDYPKFGVWPDGYYATFNMFNAAGTAFTGAKACAYDRNSMLLGHAATQQCFDTTTDYGSLLPADLDGSTLPPTGAPEQLLGLGIADAFGNGSTLAAWKFHVDWSTPANSTFTGPATLNVDPYQLACNGGVCIPQLGTSQELDSLGDRLMNKLAYRHFADGHQSMVASHSVTAGASVGERWYELRLDGTNDPSVFQQGTYAPDATYRWMGSIAQDGAGDMALGYSASSASINPQIRYTGRLAGDPSGQMPQGEGTIIAGTGSQLANLDRWGDYSQMDIDPADDCTFWYTNQYLATNGTFNWKTRIASFTFPSCLHDFSISADPTSVSAVDGTAITATIHTAVVRGSAETVVLSTTGLPSGATASLSPASVLAGATATLTLNAGTAAPGVYPVTLTGTAASAIHSTVVTFTIPDFTVSVSPPTATVTAGSSVSYTVATSSVNGSAQPIELSVTGLPSGVTGSFSPSTVIAGASATLTVSPPPNAAAASATFTVTGTSGPSVHSAIAGLTVSPLAPDFTMAVSPPSASLTAGSTVSYTVTTSSITANVPTVLLSVAGLPAGVTAMFAPPSVAAGASAVLTVAAPAEAAASTTTFSVTGTAGAVSHAAAATVSITPLAPAGATRFVAVSPLRLLDTRVAGDITGGQPVPAGGQVDLQITGAGGVPATNVSAVVLNVTAAGALAPGFVTVWPAGLSRPEASNLNVTAVGQNIANLVTVRLSGDGRVSLFSQSGSDLVVDVAGYYEPVTTTSRAGRYTPLSPTRVLDTRGALGVPGTTSLPANTQIDLAVAGHGGVPATGVRAVVLNVTAADAAGAGFVTVWPAGIPRPNASTLNVTFAGQNIANLVVVPLGAGGSVSLYTQGGGQLVADVAGWFGDDSQQPDIAGLFVPVNPSRLLDTRAAIGIASTTALPPNTAITLAIAGRGGTPAIGVGAVVLNVTAAQATAPGFITVWPSDQPQPTASNLNVTAVGQNIPNLTSVAVGADGAVAMYTQSGTHLIADIAGYYTR